jgi:hypothetical protein
MPGGLLLFAAPGGRPFVLVRSDTGLRMFWLDQPCCNLLLPQVAQSGFHFSDGLAICESVRCFMNLTDWGAEAVNCEPDVNFQVCSLAVLFHVGGLFR